MQAERKDKVRLVLDLQLLTNSLEHFPSVFTLCTPEQVSISRLFKCTNMLICWLLPSNQSFYRQIASYVRDIGILG